MVPERKKRKRKSMAVTLMPHIEGSPAEKLAMFQKLKVAGLFAKDEPAELQMAEDLLRTYAAAARMSG